jgi:hypothetical protein
MYVPKVLQDIPMKTVWIYVSTGKQVGDAEHVRVFANQDAAETWFAENDPEGVALYEVLEWKRPPPTEAALPYHACHVAFAGDKVVDRMSPVSRMANETRPPKNPKYTIAKVNNSPADATSAAILQPRSRRFCFAEK